MRRALLWITAMMCALAGSASLLAATAAAMPPGVLAVDACNDVTWDASTRTLVVRLQDDQYIGVRPRSLSFPDTVWFQDGGVQPQWSENPAVPVGLPVISIRSGTQVPVGSPCFEQFASNSVPRELRIYPIDEVATLRIVLNARSPASAVDIRQWAEVGPHTRLDFRIEIDTTAARAQSLCFMYGGDGQSCGMSDFYDARADDASQTAGVTMRMLSTHALDADGNGDAELTWSGSLARLQVGATQYADQLRFDAVAATALSLLGQGGNDQIAAATRCAIIGGDGDDTITLAGACRTALGGSGNDVIDASASPDAASMTGGPGNDRLIGSPFADVMNGAGSSDGYVVSGGPKPTDGNDTLRGGAGADDIHAGAGADIVDGAAGDDIIEGEAGNDIISAGAGRDIVHGGTGKDRIHGGSGDDTINPNGDDDIVWGDAGNDALGFSSRDRPPAWLIDNDVLSGGPGRDFIRGFSRRMKVSGGAGTDRIELSGGAPTVSGGPGNDYVFLRYITGAKVDLGPGNDVFQMGGVSYNVPVGRRTKVQCGRGRDWVDWMPLRIMNCEWQPQRDRYDQILGRPFRDDSGVPRAPSPPAAGPTRRPARAGAAR
jgi:Ca2+-binding RTX toxin-like protein